MAYHTVPTCLRQSCWIICKSWINIQIQLLWELLASCLGYWGPRKHKHAQECLETVLWSLLGENLKSNYSQRSQTITFQYYFWYSATELWKATACVHYSPWPPSTFTFDFMYLTILTGKGEIIIIDTRFWSGKDRENKIV